MSTTHITVCRQVLLRINCHWWNNEWFYCHRDYSGLLPLCDKKVKTPGVRFLTVWVDKETTGRECPSNVTTPRDLWLWGFLLPWQEALAVRPMMYTFGKHSGHEGAWVTCAFKKEKNTPIEESTSSLFILSPHKRVKRQKPDRRGWRGANRCGRRDYPCVCGVCLCVCQGSAALSCKVDLVIRIPRHRQTPTQKTTRPPTEDWAL